jgi:long-subunit fatty acid transport protein
MPLTAAAGGSYLLGDHVTLSGVATWARWSKYQDRHGERPSGDYRWSDTLSLALGGRWSAGPNRVWLDASFVPTPVPPQTGQSNYVDSDRVGFALGGDRVVTWRGGKVHVGLDALGHYILSNHVTKYPEYLRDEVPDDAIDVLGQPVPNREGLQTNNPGFPGFGVQGWVFGAGVHVGIEY